jgi:hypothetical protein
MQPTLPLRMMFPAVQLMNGFRAVFVLLAIEKVLIVPAITAASLPGLYCMPTPIAWWRL